MTKKPNQKAPKTCSQCGERSLKDVRRTRVYKGVVMQNLPATYCTNCGEELYEATTVDLMEKIAANPARYVEMVEMPLARVA